MEPQDILFHVEHSNLKGIFPEIAGISTRMARIIAERRGTFNSKKTARRFNQLTGHSLSCFLSAD